MERRPIRIRAGRPVTDDDGVGGRRVGLHNHPVGPTAPQAQRPGSARQLSGGRTVTRAGRLYARVGLVDGVIYPDARAPLPHLSAATAGVRRRPVSRYHSGAPRLGVRNHALGSESEIRRQITLYRYWRQVRLKHIPGHKNIEQQERLLRLD